MVERCRQRLKKSFSDFTGIFFALAVIFTIAIFLIILTYAFKQVEPQLVEGLSHAAPPESGVNSTAIIGKVGLTLTMFNILFPLLMIGVFAFVMIIALQDQSHPAFFFIGIIVLAVAIILAVVYSNVYTQIAESPGFASVALDFDVIGFVMEHLPSIILVLFVIISIILYSRIGVGGSQGI